MCRAVLLLLVQGEKVLAGSKLFDGTSGTTLSDLMLQSPSSRNVFAQAHMHASCRRYDERQLFVDAEAGVCTALMA